MLMNKDILNLSQFLQQHYRLLIKKHEVLSRDFNQDDAMDGVYEIFKSYVGYSPANVANCYKNFVTLMFLPSLPEDRVSKIDLNKWAVDLVPRVESKNENEH